jgi:hypothetical protein
MVLADTNCLCQNRGSTLQCTPNESNPCLKPTLVFFLLALTLVLHSPPVQSKSLQSRLFSSRTSYQVIFIPARHSRLSSLCYYKARFSPCSALLVLPGSGWVCSFFLSLSMFFSTCWTSPTSMFTSTSTPGSVSLVIPCVLSWTDVAIYLSLTSNKFQA